jgi:hypothetical protein
MASTAPTEARQTLLTWVVLVTVLTLVYWAIATYLG